MKKTIKFITAFILSVSKLSFSANAADSPEITGIYTKDSNIFALISVESAPVSAQIGTAVCDISSSPAAEYPSDTLILVDTSASIPLDIRSETAKLLSELIDGKDENEEFAIASFGTETVYLCGYTSDRYELVKAAEKLDYSEKYTYVYTALDEALKSMDSSVFGRVIMISDGVENSRDGITYDEILRTVSDAHCPVYAVGIENKNQESLKKFYAFSRNSFAESITLEADSDISGICGTLNAWRSYICAQISIPEECADGSIRYLSIKGDDYECGIDLRMPAASGTSVSETAAESEYSVETQLTEEASASADNGSESSPILYILIGAGAAAVIAVIIVLAAKRSKKNKENTSAVPSPKQRQYAETRYDTAGSGNDIIIRLTDLDNTSVSYRCALGNGVTVGRDSSQCMIAVENDEYMSKKHCRIYSSGGRIMIENYSKNNIKINDSIIVSSSPAAAAPSGSTKMILDDEQTGSHEISNGDKLRIGHTNFRFEIIG